MDIPQEDRDILRRLAEEQAEVAALPVHTEKAELWRRLNDLEPVRPMVWINEIPWHEMDVNGELTLRCGDSWAREIESDLRRLLYQWRHMPADMIVDDHITCPLVIHSSGYGLSEDVDIAKTDEASDVVSRALSPANCRAGGPGEDPGATGQGRPGSHRRELREAVFDLDLTNHANPRIMVPNLSSDVGRRKCQFTSPGTSSLFLFIFLARA